MSHNSERILLRVTRTLKVFTTWALIQWSQAGFAATSVSHQGFTWNFAGDHQTGSFVNGEPWVVGPVRITAIQRNNGQNGPQADKYNGSMLNPIPNRDQGFNVFAQNGVFTYDESLNVAFQLPKTLVPGDALVSTMHGNGEIQVKRAITLTVVNQAPASGSFRPGVYGAGPRVFFNRSQVNTSILKNLVHTAYAPSQQDMDRYTPSGTWLEWSSNWAGNTIGPAPDMVAFGFGRGDPYVDSNYGQQVAQKWGTVALWLNLQNSAANKERAIISVVQAGIDIAAWIKTGGNFYANGGHKAGRKLPLLMAAVMLNDPDMLALARNPDHFQEDQSLFFVTQSDVGRGIEPYRQEDVGLPEWGIRHRFEPNFDSRSLSSPHYRYVNATAMGAAWLAASIMELKSAWNHPVAFAYMDRIKNHFGSGTGFADSMWGAYRHGTNSIPAPSIGVQPFAKTYYVGDVVRLTLNHSDSRAVIRYTLDGSEPKQDSEVYSRSLELNQSTLIRTRAFMSGKEPSYVESFNLKLSPASDRPLDRSKWQIVDSSSEGLLMDEKANLILDGKDNTIWHTRYDSAYVNQTAPNHHITIDMGECVDVTKIGYIPRQDSINGRLQKYSLYFSKNSSSFGPALVSANFQGASQEQIVSLPATSRARFIKIVAEDMPYASIAEIFATGQRSSDQSCSDIAQPVLTVAAAQLSPAGGAFSRSVSINLSSATSGSQIRYTLDGSTPNNNSQLYSGAIVLNADGLGGSAFTSRVYVLKAIALKAGMNASSVSSASYTLTNPAIVVPVLETVQRPSFSEQKDSLQGLTLVSLQSATQGAQIRYTLDGSTPTAQSALYAGALRLQNLGRVDQNFQVRAIAQKAGMIDSSVLSTTVLVGPAPLVEVPSPSVTVSTDLRNLAAGETFLVKYTGAVNSNDWVGLFEVGKPDVSDSVLVSTFVGQLPAGSVSLTVPQTVKDGTYELRFMNKNTYVRVTQSQSLSLTQIPVAKTRDNVTVTPSVYSIVSGAALNVNYTGALNAKDWIGLFRVGSANTASSVAISSFVKGAGNGSLSLVIPRSTVKGQYELRFFENNTYKQVQKSMLIEVK